MAEEAQRDAFGQLVEWPADSGNPFEYEGDVKEETDPTPDAAATPDQPAAEPTPQQPAPQQQPEATPQAQPAEPAATTSDSSTSDEEPKTEPAAESEVVIPENDPYGAFRDEKGLILGKYKTPEDALAAHKSLDGWSTQLSQTLRQTEAERDQARQFLAEVQPILQQMQQPGQPQVAQQPPPVPDDLDVTDPQAVAQWLNQQRAEIAQQVQAQLQQDMQQQFQGQQQQQQQQQAQDAAVQQQLSAVQRFRSRFADAEPGSPIDRGVAQVFEEYRRQGVDEFGVYTDENLEVAYALAKNPQVKMVIDRFELVPNRDAVVRATEMVADPHLARFVAANPAALQADDEGWAAAKEYANLPALLQGATNGATANQQQQQDQQRRMAHLETAGGGAPVQAAPGDVPQDDTDWFRQNIVKPWEESKVF